MTTTYEPVYSEADFADWITNSRERTEGYDTEVPYGLHRRRRRRFVASVAMTVGIATLALALIALWPVPTDDLRLGKSDRVLLVSFDTGHVPRSVTSKTRVQVLEQSGSAPRIVAEAVVSSVKFGEDSVLAELVLDEKDVLRILTYPAKHLVVVVRP